MDEISSIIKIRTKKKRYSFHSLIYERNDQKDFHLSPVGLYEKWAKSIPRTPHYEIGIKNPSEEVLSKFKLHTHRSGINNKLFVCYPLEISTVWIAFGIFRIWSLGSVLTMEENIDLNTIFSTECANNPHATEKVLAERYGIICELEERNL